MTLNLEDQSALQTRLLHDLSCALRDVDPKVKVQTTSDSWRSGAKELEVVVMIGGNTIPPLVIPSQHERLDDVLWWIVDQLQDSILDGLRVVWPKCPMHAHPLNVDRVEDGENGVIGQWLCQTTGQRWGIGDLTDVGVS